MGMIKTGWLVFFGCLMLSGILTLRGKTLPRWNSIPLVAGIWILVGLIGTLLENIAGRSLVRLFGVFFVISIVLSVIALILLGILVQSGRDKLAAT
jgi:hypothetical protein